MTVFVLFAGDNYYPSGGFRDYYSTFATLDEAKVAYKTIFNKTHWGHIVEVYPDFMMIKVWDSFDA